MGTRPLATENAIWRLWLGMPVLIAVAVLATAAASESVALALAVAAGGLTAFAVLRERCDEVRREHRPLRRVLLTGAETVGVALASVALMNLFGVLVLVGACGLGASSFCGPS